MNSRIMNSDPEFLGIEPPTSPNVAVGLLFSPAKSFDAKTLPPPTLSSPIFSYSRTMVKYTGSRNSSDSSLASSAAPEKVESVLRVIMHDVENGMPARSYDLSLPEYLALDARLYTKRIRIEFDGGKVQIKKHPHLGHDVSAYFVQKGLWDLKERNQITEAHMASVYGQIERLKLASPKGPILRYADYALHLADSTRYPNCVFEVAHSQGYDDVLKRATEYLRGSRGAISAVIIINFERPLTLSKISTIEVRRWIKRGSRHPGTPSHDHENEAEAAKVRSSMPPGAVWASYRDGPRYKIFAEEDVHQAKFLRLLHQDLFGKETSTPMAEVEVDLNLLRQSIDIQLQKHREQKDYADYYEEDIVETIDEVSDDTS